MYEWELTKQASRVLLNTVSEDGKLDVCIERKGKSKDAIGLKLIAKHKGHRILEMPVVWLKENEVLQVQGLKMTIDVDAL